MTNNTKYAIIVTNVTLGGGFLENLVKFLQNTFLFGATDPELSRRLVESLSCTTGSFQKDETVYSDKTGIKQIGFILSGGCAVYKQREAGAPLLLNTLKPHDSFGVLSVFTETEEYPTVIIATRKTEVLFIDEAECKALVSKSPDVALSVIKFLASRVAFLNMKISLISGKTISEKLAIHLLPEAYKAQGNAISFNINKIASTLSVSRQTVYRGIDSLAEDGILSYENKKIIILDLEGLERLTQ